MSFSNFGLFLGTKQDKIHSKYEQIECSYSHKLYLYPKKAHVKPVPLKLLTATLKEVTKINCWCQNLSNKKVYEETN